MESTGSWRGEIKHGHKCAESARNTCITFMFSLGHCICAQARFLRRPIWEVHVQCCVQEGPTWAELIVYTERMPVDKGLIIWLIFSDARKQRRPLRIRSAVLWLKVLWKKRLVQDLLCPHKPAPTASNMYSNIKSALRPKKTQKERTVTAGVSGDVPMHQHESSCCCF